MSLGTVLIIPEKKADLLEEFKNLLVFMKEIGEQYDLPLIIGGDFNLQFEDIPENFKTPAGSLIAKIL